MSRVMSPEQLLAQLREWQVPFEPVAGWRTRRRPASTGAFGDMHGLVNHHTATPNRSSKHDVRRVLVDGRADLPGPLCHFDCARDGTIGLISIGRANHAGAVRPEIRAALLADRHPVQPASTLGETVDGNAFLYGCEVHNSGNGRYTKAQLLSLVLLNAAVLDFHRWDANSSTQHYEITRRKTDMAPVRRWLKKHDAGPWLRREVAVALAAGPGHYTKPGWRPSSAPAPTPTTDEIDLGDAEMAQRYTADGRHTYVLDVTGTARHITNAAKERYMVAEGRYSPDVKTIPQADLDQLMKG